MRRRPGTSRFASPETGGIRVACRMFPSDDGFPSWRVCWSRGLVTPRPRHVQADWMSGRGASKRLPNLASEAPRLPAPLGLRIPQRPIVSFAFGHRRACTRDRVTLASNVGLGCAARDNGTEAVCPVVESMCPSGMPDRNRGSGHWHYSRRDMSHLREEGRRSALRSRTDHGAASLH